MTGGQRTGSGAVSTGSNWGAAWPELTIAVVLVAATCIAVYVYAGLGAAVLAVSGWALVCLVALRALLPGDAQSPVTQQTWQAHGRTSFTGFWRKRGALSDAIASKASYDTELRSTLQHLLAARLAERHGVSLYSDPGQARALFLHGTRDDQLWYWLDPDRPVEPNADRRGIPPRTLAAILDRLERL